VVDSTVGLKAGGSLEAGSLGAEIVAEEVTEEVD
jgi:hypothetical protein